MERAKLGMIGKIRRGPHMDVAVHRSSVVMRSTSAHASQMRVRRKFELDTHSHRIPSVVRTGYPANMLVADRMRLLKAPRAGVWRVPPVESWRVALTDSPRSHSPAGGRLEDGWAVPRILVPLHPS